MSEDILEQWGAVPDDDWIVTKKRRKAKAAPAPRQTQAPQPSEADAIEALAAKAPALPEDLAAAWGAGSQRLSVSDEFLDDQRKARQVGHFKVKPGSGASTIDRLKLSFANDNVARYRILKQSFPDDPETGEPNVLEVLGNDGKAIVGFRVRASRDRPWQFVDPGTDDPRLGGTAANIAADALGDVADVAGPFLTEALPAAAGTAAGAIVGGAPGAIAGDMLGSTVGTAARHAIESELTGDPIDRDQLRRDATLNTAFGLGGAALTGVGRLIRPAARDLARSASKEKFFDGAAEASAGADGAASGAAREIVGEVEEEFAADAARMGARRPVTEAIPDRVELSKRTGVDLSLGQVTGSRKLLQQEDALSAIGKYADEIGGANIRRLGQLRTFLGKTLDATLGKNSLDYADGGGPAAAYRAYTSALDDARRAASRPHFVKADELLGGQKAIRVERFLGAIDDLIERFETRGSTSGTQKIVGQLKTMRKRFEAEPNVSVGELSSMLTDWGASFRSGATDAFDGADPRRAKAITGRLFRALQEDMDQAADVLHARASDGRFMKMADAERVREAAGAIREGRRVYAELSRPLEEADSSILRRALKLEEDDAGDMIPKLFLENPSPKRVRNAVKIMEQASPAEASRLKASALRALVDDIGSDGIVSADRLVTAATKRRGQIMALLGSDPEAMRMWDDAVRVAKILKDRGLPPGSQTASRLFNADTALSTVADDAVSGGLTGAAVGAARRTVKRVVSGATINAKQVARYATDPEARDEFTALIARHGRGVVTGRDITDAMFHAMLQTGMIEIRDSATSAGGIEDIEVDREKRRRDERQMRNARAAKEAPGVR